MRHVFNAVLHPATGAALEGILVRVFDSTDTLVDIYADDSSTPIETVSEVENAAATDSDGMYSFYVPGGVYTLRFYQGDTVIKTIANVDLGEDVTRTELSDSAGGALVGLIQPLTGAVARDAQDKAREIVSALDFMSETERAAARSGDLSVDHTTAIQAALDSGASVLDMLGLAYRIDSVVDLPTTGIRIIGKGWSAERGAGVENNGGKMFSAVEATGAISFEGGTVTGNVDRLGTGYDSFAAGLWFEECTGGVTLTDMVSTGFAVGCYVKYVDGFTVIRGRYHGNVLTGISGFANNVLVDGATLDANGYSGSLGLTHDLYIINGEGGVVRNCYIGDHLDSATDSLSLRYDDSGAITDFDNCTNWEVYGNTFSANGVRISSDPGADVADRRPPSNMLVFSNTFKGGADLRFDDPQACRSWGNKGIDQLIVGVASSYTGYVIGLISENDECVGIYTNSLSAKRLEARDGVVFKTPVINNGSSTAINEISGFGGFTACTIVEPRILGTGNPFDTASLARYQTNLEIPVRAAKSMRHMDRAGLTEVAIANAGTWTPANHTASEEPFLVGRFNGTTGTVGAPTVAATGMRLRLLIRAVGATLALTFNSAYKLTANTQTAITSGGVVNNRIILEFVYEGAAWRQIGDASWTAA